MRRDRRKIDGKIEPTSSHKKKGKGRKKKVLSGVWGFSAHLLTGKLLTWSTSSSVQGGFLRAPFGAHFKRR